MSLNNGMKAGCSGLSWNFGNENKKELVPFTRFVIVILIISAHHEWYKRRRVL